jgi:uncharacterized protein with ParB-like and HNH nuclease domain
MDKLIYKDIPKFTGNGNYHFDVDLDYAKKWLDEHIEKYGLQLNPDFQRGNVWTQKQKIAYIEFLIRGGMTSRDIYFNHPGWMNSFKGEFVCVDGLQRLTSVLEFMNNELLVFDGHYLKDIDKIPFMTVTLKFHINDLKTRKEVLKWYLEFNSGGTVHTEAELDKVRKMIEEEATK